MPQGASFIIDQTDLARFYAVTKSLKWSMRRPLVFLNYVGDEVEREIMDAFRHERSPNDNTPWPDLAASTKAGRRKGKRLTGKESAAKGMRYRHATGRWKGGKKKGQMSYGGFKILQDNGRFKGSFNKRVSLIGAAVAVGTNISSKKGYNYPKAHQYGLGNNPKREVVLTSMSRPLRRAILRGIAKQVRASKAAPYIS